jgi:hypothetical protein
MLDLLRYRQILYNDRARFPSLVAFVVLLVSGLADRNPSLAGLKIAQSEQRPAAKVNHLDIR